MVKEQRSAEGVFCREIYHNDQYGTTIARYRDKQGCEFTVTGVMLPISKNITYRFIGEWVNHARYGEQYKAESYEEIIGNDAESLVAYLSSGIIQGIGRITAERIVKHFGIRTLEILDNDIYRLMEVKGISARKLDSIKDSYKKSRQARDIILTLGKYGISPKMAMEVFQKYKGNSMDIIKNKPYMLSSIEGISFTLADSIAERTVEYECDPERFNSCAWYVLLANENNSFRNIIGNRPEGSLGMDKDDFGKVMYNLLRYKNINEQYILSNTIRMIKEGSLVYRKGDKKCLLFLPGIYRIENETANHIHRLATVKIKNVAGIERLIEDAQRFYKISLSGEQCEAIRKAFANNLSMIIGPPGTGKTTLIKCISYIYKKIYGNNLQFVAPSGMAASRIKETTQENASTVHSILGIGTETLMDVISGNEDYVIRGCLLVVDEMSMIDSRTAYRLFSAIKSDCRVVICGDDEQLQSVSAGAVLRDMIDSGVIPTTFLKYVYRQSSEKANYTNSFLIRDGNANLHYDDSFRFVETNDPQEMEDQMIKLYLQKVHEYGIKNVMLISPFKKHSAGVKILNSRIQSIINPSRGEVQEVKGASGVILRIGDEIMNLKNGTEDNPVVNGEIGTIVLISINGDDFKVAVNFPDSEKVYTKDNIKDLTLAYAYTVHKAQGSEAKCVITCIHQMHSVMLKRNIYYTAITRARDEVITIGQRAAMQKAILTEDKSQRNTYLKLLLKMKFGEFV